LTFALEINEISGEGASGPADPAAPGLSSP